jgi:hypothetical protein
MYLSFPAACAAPVANVKPTVRAMAPNRFFISFFILSPFLFLIGKEFIVRNFP